MAMTTQSIEVSRFPTVTRANSGVNEGILLLKFRPRILPHRQPPGSTLRRRRRTWPGGIARSRRTGPVQCAVCEFHVKRAPLFANAPPPAEINNPVAKSGGTGLYTGRQEVSRMRFHARLLPVAGAACLLAQAAFAQFLYTLPTITTLASTVPANGDQNPYG